MEWNEERIFPLIVILIDWDLHTAITINIFISDASISCAFVIILGATTRHKGHKVGLYAKLSAHEARNTFCPQFRNFVSVIRFVFLCAFCASRCFFTLYALDAFSYLQLPRVLSWVFSPHFLDWQTDKLTNPTRCTDQCVAQIYIVPHAVLHVRLMQPKGILLLTSCLINMPHALCHISQCGYPLLHPLPRRFTTHPPHLYLSFALSKTCF